MLSSGSGGADLSECPAPLQAYDLLLLSCDCTMAAPLRPRSLTTGSLPRNLFRLAAPIAVGHALHVVYSLVDTFWLGRFDSLHGAHALGGPGVSLPFLFLIVSAGMGFGTAGTALVSQHTGADRPRDADRAAGQVFLLLCGLCAIFALPGALSAGQILRIARAPAVVVPHAVPYMQILMLGLPAMAVGMAYDSVLRALGDTMTPLLIGAGANLLNFVLDPLLIMGLDLGAAGAAWATLISRLCAAVACIILLRRHHAGLHVRLADLMPDWPVLRQILRVGMPAAIGSSVTAVGFALYQVMVNELDETVVKAFLIGFRVIMFVGIPAQAMSMAAAPIVGQALGAGKPGLARRAIWTSVGLVAVAVVLPYALLTWQGALVARVFIDDPKVIAEARSFFLIVPASSYFFGVIMVLMAAFYGSGHTRPVMVLAFVRLWVLRLPIAYVLGFVLGRGSRGVYEGMMIGNILSALLALWLFYAGDWLKAIVPVTSQEGSDESPTPPASET